MASAVSWHNDRVTKPQYSGPWRRIRAQVLERDGGLCQIRGPRCTGTATAVDHIVPVQSGGPWFDPANLRACCVTCNNGRIASQRNEAWRTGRTRIALVVGPPGAGKTTYVNENRNPGDLVVDYDAIAVALGGAHTADRVNESLHGATMAARNAVLTKLRQGKLDVARCWLISANPRAEQILPYHSVVKIDPGIDVVLARLDASGHGEEQARLVREWYAVRSGTAPKSAHRPSRDW